MKYEVHFSCGHTARIELFGPCKDRERKIAWYEESGLCPDCYRAKVEAKNAEGCTETEMFYGEYREKYGDCMTKANSYNAKTKTIIVYVPKDYKADRKEEKNGWTMERFENEIKELGKVYKK